MKRGRSRNAAIGGVLVLAILGMVAAVLWPSGSGRVDVSGRGVALTSVESTPSFSVPIRTSEVRGVNPTMLDCPAVGTCYLTGNPPSVTDKNKGTLVTHNGGRTWLDRAPDLGTTLTCVSADVCAGSNGFGRFVRTVNGGKTWTSRPLPGRHSDDVTCSTAKDCVAMSSFTGKAEVTTNAGRTWRLTPLPSGLKDFQAFGIQCFVSGHCDAIGNVLNFQPGTTKPKPGKGFVGPTYALYSTDGGLRWHEGTIPAHFMISTNLSCGTAMDCMALGTDGRSPAIATSDGGRKWHAVTDPGGRVSKDGYWWVNCVGTSECWMAADQDHGSSLGLVETTNLGRSWRLLRTPKGVSSASTISCATTTRCYATADLPAGAKTPATPPSTVAPVTLGDSLFLAWRLPAS